MRNSERFDLLFVMASHHLAPDMLSLYKRCAHLTVNERAKVKEKINPVSRFVTGVWHKLFFAVMNIQVVNVGE